MAIKRYLGFHSESLNVCEDIKSLDLGTIRLIKHYFIIYYRLLYYSYLYDIILALPH